MLWSQRNSDCAQGFARRSTPKRVCRNVAANHGTRFYDGAFANSDIRQNNAVRHDEHILFYYYFSNANRLSRPRVKMGNDRCSKTNDTVIADAYVFGMYLVDVYKLADPNIFANRNSAQPMEPVSEAESTWSKQSDFPKNSTEQHGQFARPPLININLLRRCARACRYAGGSATASTGSQ